MVFFRTRLLDMTTKANGEKICLTAAESRDGKQEQCTKGIYSTE